MNQLFVCTRCNCVDLVEFAFATALPSEAERQLCTMCKTGTWHNRFEYSPYRPEEDLVVNRPTGIALE